MIDVELSRSEPMQAQLTRVIREKILSNELPVGLRLPPAAEWAKQFGTSYFTVHQALQPLVREGLIERRPSLGTFVRANRPVSSMVIGIYCSRSFWTQKEFAFVRSVQELMRNRLADSGHQSKLWIDERPMGEQDKPLPELEEAVKTHSIQGLAVLLANAVDIRWLKKLPLPSSFYSSANLPNKVSHDFRQFLRLGLDRLKAQGCRTVGFIAGVHPTDGEDGVQRPFTTFFDDYMELCRERGLEFRNSWICSAEEGMENAELFGYCSFQKMWAQPERPDGLIVFHDVVALGVTKAMIDGGIEEDRRPRLAFHRNKRTRQAFPPVLANWITNDEQVMVDGLILQIMKQAEGAPPPPIIVPFVISSGEELP